MSVNEFNERILEPGVYEVIVTKKLRVNINSKKIIEEGLLIMQAFFFGETESFEIKSK